MARRKLSGLRGIVTGASSGIGEALALELAQRGVKLIITARRAERLETLAAKIRSAGGTVEIIPGDITDAAVRERVLTTAHTAYGGLDLLVNNAGRGEFGPFAEATPERLRSTFELNFFAAVELTRQALPLLQQGTAPLVVNVASVLGHFGVPGKSEYCASKFALLGFSNALRYELAHHKIGVLVVSPSTTASEFFEHADPNTAAAWTRTAMTCEQVALAAARAMERGSAEVILSTGGRFIVALDAIFPSLARWIVNAFANPPADKK